jgi:hypothetical protein
MITLINLRNKPPPKYDLYMGRANKWLNLPQSKWANPFVMKNESQRSIVCEKYREYILSKPELIESLPEIRNKTLACWCPKNKQCHVKVLIELHNQYYPEYKQEIIYAN